MSIKLNDIYRCDECTNSFTVEALGDCDCELSCCGKPMKQLKENTVDAAKEKHVPVIEKVDGGYKVKVGSVAHPMDPDHWIVYIELLAGNQVLRQNLKPGEAPEAVFMTKATDVIAREYCNKHGLWKV